MEGLERSAGKPESEFSVRRKLTEGVSHPVPFRAHLLSHLYPVENRALPAADSLAPLAHEVLLPTSTFYCNVCTAAARYPHTPSGTTGSDSSPSTET